MNCTWTNPCSVCLVIIKGKQKAAPQSAKLPLQRTYRLHLHPAPTGKGYIALALHRALKIKTADAKQLARFGGWVRPSTLHVDELIELARRIDRLAKAPIAVVR